MEVVKELKANLKVDDEILVATNPVPLFLAAVAAIRRQRSKTYHRRT